MPSFHVCEPQYLLVISINIMTLVLLASSPVEDIKLNSTVFHWPDHIQTVFDVNQGRLATRREHSEEELKKKITNFDEKLQEYNKEIEAFRKKEVRSLEMLSELTKLYPCAIGNMAKCAVLLNSYGFPPSALFLMMRIIP